MLRVSWLSRQPVAYNYIYFTSFKLRELTHGFSVLMVNITVFLGAPKVYF